MMETEFVMSLKYLDVTIQKHVTIHLVLQIMMVLVNTLHVQDVHLKSPVTTTHLLLSMMVLVTLFHV